MTPGIVLCRIRTSVILVGPFQLRMFCNDPMILSYVIHRISFIRRDLQGSLNPTLKYRDVSVQGSSLQPQCSHGSAWLKSSFPEHECSELHTRPPQVFC